MGANQSRPCEATVNEKLMERLQALNMKDDRPMNEKDGFVVVGGEPGMIIWPKSGAQLSYADVQSSQIYPWCKVPTGCICRLSVRVGEGAYGGPKGTTATTLLSTYALLTHHRTASLSQLSARTPPTPSSRRDRRSSPIPKSSTSKYPLRAHRSPIKLLQDAAGSLPRPTSSASPL